jgi:hypothetical protein
MIILLYHALQNRNFAGIEQTGMIEARTLHTARGPNTLGLDGQPVKYLMAGEDLTMACLYNLKSPEMLRCGQIQIQGNSLSYTVITKREKFIQEYKGGKIIELPKDTFRRNWNEGEPPNGEWISEQNVALKKCRIIDVPDIETVMYNGGQIFFLNPKISRQNYLDNYEPISKEEAEIKIAQLVKDGILIHENAEWNINPINLDTGKMHQTHSAEGKFLVQIDNQLAALEIPHSLTSPTNLCEIAGNAYSLNTGKNVKTINTR